MALYKSYSKDQKTCAVTFELSPEAANGAEQVTPLRLPKILRKLGNMLLSSTLRIICVISFYALLDHLCTKLVIYF